MTDDPLTDHLRMRSIHSFRFWHLFNEQGRPVVLYRRKHTKKHKDGTVTNELDVEWGTLESWFFTDDTRQQFTDAWNEFTSWSKDNK